MIDFVAEAHALRDEVIERRRDFHRHPEIAFEEFRTSGIVADVLNELGLEVQTGVGKTGVVGILEGDEDGPTVLYRADMDALPVQEENDVEYASTIPGKMHACGHDAHTAIALGVAKLLSKHRDKLAGRIKFVFQPAEETVGGAVAMVADGVLENPRPDVSVGLHVWNWLSFGEVAISDGPIMAGSDTIEITIIGKGIHAAFPNKGTDPVVCAAHLIVALQTITSRNLDPYDSAVVSITRMQGSDANNIIPERVVLGGTVRTFTPEVREMVMRRIQEISESLCAAMGCDVKIEVLYSTKSVINDPEVSGRLRMVLDPLIESGKMVTDERTMGSEDVGQFMTDIPGTFIFVGSANDEKGLNYGHHHPRFNIDEEVLPYSVSLMATAIADYVIKS